MSTLAVIMAHHGAEDTIVRHLPIWKKVHEHIKFFQPEGEPVSREYECLKWGHAEHHGIHSIERFIWLLWYLERQPFDSFVIHEYDSLSLAAPDIQLHVIRGNVFPETSLNWIGKMFIHPPLAFTKEVLQEIVRATGYVPSHAEKAFWDRWLGLVVEMAEISVLSWGKTGYAQNTIEPHHLDSAREAKKNGAVHWHGVKNVEALNIIA